MTQRYLLHPTVMKVQYIFVVML